MSATGDVAIVVEHTITDGGVLERIRRDIQEAVEGMDGVGRVDLAMREKSGATGQPAATAKGQAGPGKFRV